MPWCAVEGRKADAGAGRQRPEAALGRDVDARTDIFAVGIILWELLAGRRLFLGKTDLETVKLVQRADVPDIRQVNASVPPSVVKVMGRLLAGDPQPHSAGTSHLAVRPGRQRRAAGYQRGRTLRGRQPRGHPRRARTRGLCLAGCRRRA